MFPLSPLNTLFWYDDSSKPSLGAMVICLLRLLERKFLYHALDISKFGKLNRFFHVFRCTSWPTTNGSTLGNQRGCSVRDNQYLRKRWPWSRKITNGEKWVWPLGTLA